MSDQSESVVMLTLHMNHIYKKTAYGSYMVIRIEVSKSVRIMQICIRYGLAQWIPSNYMHICRGGSRILGKGGSDKYIHNWGEGTGGGVPPPVTARGFWGSVDSSPSGVWGEAPAAFLLMRLFSMKFTVISNT